MTTRWNHLSITRRTISTAAGVLLLIVGCAAFAVRYAPLSGHLSVFAVVVSPFLMPAAPAALVVLAWGRRWTLAALATCLTVAVVAVLLPSYVAEPPEPGSVPVRVMTINMFFGRADPRVVDQIADENADVVLVQELTPEAVQRLSATGIARAFPHQVLDARPDAAGVGIYSRYPMGDSTRIGGYQLAMVSARVRVDGQDIGVISAHFAAPWPQPIAGWQSDFAAFPHTLAALAEPSANGTVIVGGDFNATIDMRPFRRLLDNGYRDAAEQAGAGRNLTYPADRSFPPLIGIDHVLTRHATAVSTSTVQVAGSDHRGLLTTVMVPRR